MNAYNYILSKQIQWAYRNKKILIGSKGNRGYPAYTCNLEDNLFAPLSTEIRNNFIHGDGGELNNYSCKMQAVQRYL